MSRLDYFMKYCKPEVILEQYETEKFDEIIWEMGGDVYCTRVYGNSSDEFYMTEK